MIHSCFEFFPFTSNSKIVALTVLYVQRFSKKMKDESHAEVVRQAQHPEQGRRAKRAPHKQNCKSETRNPNFETISNGQKSESSKQARFGLRNWGFMSLGLFRISIFEF